MSDYSSWSHYVDLTVDGTVPGLSGVTKGVAKVGIPAALKAVCQANGEDLRVTKADGTTDVYGFGIEDWTAAAPVVHVKRIDWGTGDTVCRVYGGKTGVADAQNKTNVAKASVVYLPLGDAGPTYAVDWSVYGYDGTQSGGLVFGAAGKVGGAVTFADNKYMDLQDPVELELDGQFSLLAWVKPSTVSGLRTILGKLLYGAGAKEWGMYANNDRFYAKIANGTADYIASAPATFTAGNWYRVVAIRDATDRLYLYVDGVAGTNGVIAGAINPTYNCYLGRRGSASQFWWNGEIDDVVIDNVALTVDEILFDAKSYPGSAMFSWGSVTAQVVVHWRVTHRHAYMPGVSLSAVHLPGAVRQATHVPGVLLKAAVPSES